ncbi:MAG TPA: hypothetical protein VKY92_20475 [Verrucomicrobiae bacterium]|nr:hypothetical protein [Verrucomicrobiae bacterium]
MSLSLRAQTACLCCSLVLGLPGLLTVQAVTYTTNGLEYAIAGSKPGDQVHPDIALSPGGGFLVWEDNATSASGLAVSAMRLDSSFSSSLASFKVNSSNTGDHEAAKVSLLSGGGAVFVWQGGQFGFQHIYARFLSASNTWLTSDILVNSSTNFSQKNPVVATLRNGNVVVLWSSLDQYSSGSMQDVYGQMFSASGQKIGGEFMVNQFALYNQRTPAVAALSTGGFVVAWVSEQQRSVASLAAQVTSPSQLVMPSVDIYARLYNSSGQALNNEFLVNATTNACANPAIAAGQGGSFLIGWGQKDTKTITDSWDVFARVFNSSGVGGPINRINTETYGDQFAPQISSAGSDYLLVWTSLGQDSSMEGVYGQFLAADGSTNGPEFRVNTTWVNKQMHPAVSSDGVGRFAVVWTSFTGGQSTFDLFAQRYVSGGQPLQPMSAPFAYVPFVTSNGQYQPQIVVSWPMQTGLAVDHYEVYVDGSMAASSTNNTWTMTAANGLTASSTHSFQVLAVQTDGSKTPLSPSTTATTWGGYNWGGIPFEWMAQLYGMDSSAWPPASGVLAPGGPTLYQVFLTGGSPTDPNSWLRTSIEVAHVQGQPVYLLQWNTHPGLTYQVQTSSDMQNWVNFQSPRLAADVVDSVPVPTGNLQYYRLVRLR